MSFTLFFNPFPVYQVPIWHQPAVFSLFEAWIQKTCTVYRNRVNKIFEFKYYFQVHDYVKSYVGEGKAQKKFATDYLERRSRWKNSLKSGARYEDDLFSTNTITPGDGEFQVRCSDQPI